MMVAIYRVKVIERLAPGKRKHSAGDYLVLASSPEEARENVSAHLGEWINPIHVSKGSALEGGPIPFTHYLMDPSQVSIVMRASPPLSSHEHSGGSDAA
jgi:hypothetical protein